MYQYGRGRVADVCCARAMIVCEEERSFIERRPVSSLRIFDSHGIYAPADRIQLSARVVGDARAAHSRRALLPPFLSDSGSELARCCNTATRRAFVGRERRILAPSLGVMIPVSAWRRHSLLQRPVQHGHLTRQDLPYRSADSRTCPSAGPASRSLESSRGRSRRGPNPRGPWHRRAEHAHERSMGIWLNSSRRSAVPKLAKHLVRDLAAQDLLRPGHTLSLHASEHTPFFPDWNSARALGTFCPVWSIRLNARSQSASTSFSRRSM